MKQLEVMNFASLTGKSSKIQQKAVSQNKEYIWLKNMQLIKFETFRSLET